MHRVCVSPGSNPGKTSFNPNLMQEKRRFFLKKIGLLSGAFTIYPFFSILPKSLPFASIPESDLESQLQPIRTLFYKHEFELCESLCKVFIKDHLNYRNAYVLLRKVLKSQNKDLDILQLFYESSLKLHDNWFKEQFVKAYTSAGVGNIKAYNAFNSAYPDMDISIFTSTERCRNYINLRKEHNIAARNNNGGRYKSAKNRVRHVERSITDMRKSIERTQHGRRRVLYFEHESNTRQMNHLKYKRGCLGHIYNKEVKLKDFNSALITSTQLFNADVNDRHSFGVLKKELLIQRKTSELLSVYQQIPDGDKSFWFRLGYAKVLREHFINTNDKNWMYLAIAEYQKMLNEYGEIISHNNLMTLHNSIGICHRLLKNYRQAIDYYISVISEVDEEDVSDYEDFVIGYTKVYLDMDDKRGARNLVLRYYPDLVHGNMNTDSFNRSSNIINFYRRYF